jgi:hypothetical protein
MDEDKEERKLSSLRTTEEETKSTEVEGSIIGYFIRVEN